ncbi:type IV pilus twitching motility protein PilT [bacterium]|nr:type IV pilus twitching motility protein PilT [bacterium]
MELFHDILKSALKFNASDIHLKVGAPPIVRVDGNLYPFKDFARLSVENLQSMSELMMGPVQKEYLRDFHEVDLGYGVPGIGRFRVNIYQQRSSLVIAMRTISFEILDLTTLNMPEIVEKMVDEHRRGLILVTGTTGSGKSTTLAAMIDYINRNRSENIITIEDPIEYLHRDNMSLINQREVGFDTTSFALALRAALRQDPDVILVGEMRDLETISLALSCASLGILVFGTLHTNSAAKTIDRIIDAFPAEQQGQIRSMLGDSLVAVVAQQLVRTRDGKGRCAANEILIGSPALANLIREGKISQIPSLIQIGAAEGMQTLDQALMKLVKEKKITMEAAYEKAQDKNLFADDNSE